MNRSGCVAVGGQYVAEVRDRSPEHSGRLEVSAHRQECGEVGRAEGDGLV